MFLMGRPIERSASRELISDPTYHFSKPDTWFVWLAAGAPPWECLRHMPYFLPYVGWQRLGRLRFYDTNILSYRAQLTAPATPKAS